MSASASRRRIVRGIVRQNARRQAIAQNRPWPGPETSLSATAPARPGEDAASRLAARNRPGSLITAARKWSAMNGATVFHPFSVVASDVLASAAAALNRFSASDAGSCSKLPEPRHGLAVVLAQDAPDHRQITWRAPPAAARRRTRPGQGRPAAARGSRAAWPCESVGPSRAAAFSSGSAHWR